MTHRKHIDYVLVKTLLLLVSSIMFHPHCWWLSPDIFLQYSKDIAAYIPKQLPIFNVVIKNWMRWRTPSIALLVGRDIHWGKFLTACWMSILSWDRYSKVPILDLKQFFSSSGSSGPSKLSRVGGCEPLAVSKRRCLPHPGRPPFASSEGVRRRRGAARPKSDSTVSPKA